MSGSSSTTRMRLGCNPGCLTAWLSHWPGEARPAASIVVRNHAQSAPEVDISRCEVDVCRATGEVSRVAARPDSIARAFVDVEGRLQAATPAFQQHVEVPPAPLPTAEPELWVALGLRRDAQHPGAWSRADRRWFPSVEPLGEGLLLTLHPAEPQKTMVTFLSIAGHDIRGPL